MGQPLGEMDLGEGHPGVDITLTGRVRPRDNQLSERIAGAVAEAVAAGDQSRKDVFAQFAAEPKTVVYRHIARVLEATGGKLAPTKVLARRVTAMTEAEEDAELAAVMPAVEEIEQLIAGEAMQATEPPEPVAEQVEALQAGASPVHSAVEEEAEQLADGEVMPTPELVERAVRRHPGSGRDLVVGADGEATVDIAAGMVKALSKADALMNLAEHPDGSGIRNARLMVVAVDLYGRTAERKSRVDSDLADGSRQDAFLRQVGEAIMAEEPAVRKRILSRLRSINPQWGVG